MKRFRNKGTLALQIVYAVICAVLAVLMFIMIGEYVGAGGNDAGAAVGLVIYLIAYIFAVCILFVVALLFWIFCKRPLIATFGYALLAIAFGMALIVLNL